MNVLLTGASGLLGPYIFEAVSSIADITRISTDDKWLQCDLEEYEQVKACLAGKYFDVVIHLVAATDVDRCESDPLWAHRKNVLTTKHLVKVINKDAHFIYMSTDQVYSGIKILYGEADTFPINEYGKTKKTAEDIALSLKNSCVIRSNIFGPSKSENRISFSDFLVDRLSHRKELTLFDDLFFSPVHMETLAHIFCEVIRNKICGIYNVGSKKGLSKADFAIEIAKHLNLPTQMAKIGPASNIAGRAKRPQDVRLDVSKIEAVLHMEMPDLIDEVRKL